MGLVTQSPAGALVLATGWVRIVVSSVPTDGSTGMEAAALVVHACRKTP